MSKIKDYTKIPVPYDFFLHRKNGLSYDDSNNNQESSNSSDGTVKTSGGSVSTVALKDDGSATDIWIKSFIRSSNWKPKIVGFTIDGGTGYAEFTDVFISGNIVAKTGQIGGFSISSKYIIDIDDTFGLSSVVSGSDDVRFWAGDTFANRDTAPLKITESGVITAESAVITGTSTIGGRNASTLASAIDASGHFADNAIDTAAGTILTEFIFSGSGALQIGTYANGDTGDINFSPNGILARDKTGATTFSLNGETGVAVLNGLIVGTNVGLGTAEDSAGVTTIVGATVTTGFVDALNITAGSVSASDITSGTITSKTIALAVDGGGNSYIAAGKTAFTNAQTGFILGLDDNDDLPKFYIGSSTSFFNWTGTAFNVYGATITGGIIQTAESGTRIVLSSNTLITYNSSNQITFEINNGVDQTLLCYSDGDKRALTLFENTNAAADVLYIEMGAGTGRAINILDTGASTAEVFRLATNSGIAMHLQTNASSGDVNTEIYHLDLDKTGFFVSDNISNNANNQGLVEIISGATSGALGTCFLLYANSTANYSHLRLLGGPTPSAPAAGDIWFDGNELYIRIGATTYKLDRTAV